MVELQIDYHAIGKRIRAARKAKNMTQEKLATAANLAPNHISNIETGSTKLSLPAILQISRILETDVNSLLYDNVPTLIDSYDADVKSILHDCDIKERCFLIDLLDAAKALLRKNSMCNNLKTSRPLPYHQE